MTDSTNAPVPALKVRQWLEEWEALDFKPDANQAKPKPHFYLFSMPASELRKLSDIYRRGTEEGLRRSDDLRIQRKLDPVRSEEISRYVRGGYPWSALNEAKRAKPENDSLKKPGWLPTALVVNLLEVGDVRAGATATVDSVITITDREGSDYAELHVPTHLADDALPPMEVIDGQHRLFAFDPDDAAGDDYNLPVVAFHGLDISWQAYLFWTINIKPKKINASLAFDLYPLLREQDWLEQGEAVLVYRESRAQELTEVLWSMPESPWYHRINMLGGNRKEYGPVTQAAFIRSLIASLIKPWRAGTSGAGGLFGGKTDDETGLGWSRLQQSAFLLTAWRQMQLAVEKHQGEWSESLRETERALDLGIDVGTIDAAFAGRHTLLATDQGVRGFQSIINDLCYFQHRALDLDEWVDGTAFTDVTPELVAATVSTLEQQPVFGFLVEVCEALASYDWRSSSAPMADNLKRDKAALRGSGGYKQLREELSVHLRNNGSSKVRRVADSLKVD